MVSTGRICQFSGFDASQPPDGMEDRLDRKVNRLLELEKRRRQSFKAVSSSSSQVNCSEDQIEEAETVGFSWNVEEIMNGTGKIAELNNFSQNPAAVELMVSCYLLPSDLYASFGSSSGGSNPNYHQLLDDQNRGWGEQKVLEGIAAARDDKYELAIEYCKAALSFIPYSVEAYVCRGASYANLNINDKAIKDFERALVLDPTNQNASQYLKRIRDSTQKVAAAIAVILPAEAVETRKPEWHVIPSKLKLQNSGADLIVKLGTTGLQAQAGSGAGSLSRAVTDTVNGYSFERSNSKGNSSSDSGSSRSSEAKKRKREREKEGKSKKSKKDDKRKKSRKQKDKKKEKKERKKSVESI